MKTYYAPNEIRYDRDSIEWFMREAWHLDSWPKPKSGYLDVPLDIQHTTPQSMPNQTFIEVRCEIDRRVKMLPIIEGAWIFAHYVCGFELYDMAKEAEITLREISRRINRGMNFISWGQANWNKKTQSFKRPVNEKGQPDYKAWCDTFQERARKAANKRWEKVA